MAVRWAALGHLYLHGTWGQGILGLAVCVGVTPACVVFFNGTRYFVVIVGRQHDVVVDSNQMAVKTVFDKLVG